MTGEEIAKERADELRATETPPPDAKALIILSFVMAGGIVYGACRAFSWLLEAAKGWVL